MTRFAIHGARGSHAVCGERFRKYGGSTSCFSIETDQGILILDAGSGIASLGHELCQRQILPPITILFTHFHLDHVIGLPAFQPFFRKDATMTLMANPATAGDWQRTLHTIIGKPFWPVGLSETGATLHFEDLPLSIQGPIELYGARISWCQTWHPQMSVSYRIETNGRVFVLATDREHGQPHLDSLLAEFCRGADVLIHDAQYTPAEYPSRCGWGHSTWEESVRVAAMAGVKSLILTSHDPDRSDQEVDQIVERARTMFPNTCAAAEHMMVT